MFLHDTNFIFCRRNDNPHNKGNFSEIVEAGSKVCDVGVQFDVFSIGSTNAVFVTPLIVALNDIMPLDVVNGIGSRTHFSWRNAKTEDLLHRSTLDAFCASSSSLNYLRLV